MHLLVRRCALASALFSGAHLLEAQQQFADATVSGPRFLLLTSATKMVPVDVSRTPMLKRQVSLDLDGLSVRDALAAISHRTGIDIAYATDLIRFEAIVHLKADDITVAAALTDVLSDAPVDIVFTKDGRATIMSRGAASAIMAAGTITGRATAAVSGEPITGVTVRVADTKLGAVSGADGRYRIDAVPEGTHTLFATRIGFARDSQTVTVAAGQTATADFSLHEVAVRLSEVVSIGYETTSRRELTGAVASVSSSDLTEAPVPQFDQALTGKAAGVTVVSANGQPGTASEVRIRGGNSISAGNDPLYVIDGIPLLQSPEELRASGSSTLEVQGPSGLSPLAGLNPDDIQSIDVLKDASATSIYGARAANGVILITTKRGHAGNPVVNISGYYGSSSVRHQLPLMDAQQFATVANEARVNIGAAPLYTQAQINSFGAGTNWQDQIFRAAPSSNLDNYSIAKQNTNPENIFSVNFGSPETVTGVVGSIAILFGLPSGFPGGDAYGLEFVLPSVVNSFSATDQRGNGASFMVSPYTTHGVLDTTITWTAPPGAALHKPLDETDPQNMQHRSWEQQPNYQPVLRYSDVLLMYAEAVANGGSGNAGSAASALDQVRLRGDPNASPSAGLANFMDTLRVERRKEFIYEGQRWFDLSRWGILDQALRAKQAEILTIYPQEFKAVHGVPSNLFPIPQTEINADPQLTQNPGWQ